jgi:hypothetical protein
MEKTGIECYDQPRLQENKKREERKAKINEEINN